MAFEVVTYAAAKGAAKTYTDSVVETLGHGMNYKGSVPTVDDLPTTPTKGDCYTVLTNGHEWVYDGTQWVDLSADLDNKQDKLISGTNIKTINGASIVGAGNVAIRTYQPVPETWNIDGTTNELVADIINDDSAVKGMAYLDTIGCLDLPEGLGSGEAIIEIISGEGEDKIILIKLNSADTPPYNWEFNSFEGGWRPCSMEYSNGYGINLEDNEFSIDENVVVTHEALEEYHDDTKQDTLVVKIVDQNLTLSDVIELFDSSANYLLLDVSALQLQEALVTFRYDLVSSAETRCNSVGLTAGNIAIQTYTNTALSETTLKSFLELGSPIVTRSNQLIQVGQTGQTAPSNDMLVGGIFFEEV